MFIGREKEIKEIQRILNEDSKSAIMLYGTRRVGKSTLILETVKNSNCKVLYYECLLTSFEENLRNLEKKIQEIFQNRFLHFESFQDMFEFLGTTREKVIIILDEYSYLKMLEKSLYVDSLFQSIIDQMKNNIKLILLGSYVSMMKELLEKENPLFGRFSLIMNVKPFDYYDASLFYPKSTVSDKIAYYSIWGGSPFSNSLLKESMGISENVKSLLLNPNSPLRIYIENILLSEMSKISSANMILSALSNGKKRYSELESQLHIKSNGALDKQLKNLIQMEIIQKVTPINKANDKKKTFYEISDNLIRFYYHYIYKNVSIISTIGEDAFYDLYIAPGLKHYISHRFEEIAREYFSRKIRSGRLTGVYDVGTFWYDDPKKKTNGEFDCVLKHDKSYSFYEVKYYENPFSSKDAAVEEEQLKALSNIINIEKIGFICSSGFDFVSSTYELINGAELYNM